MLVLVSMIGKVALVALKAVGFFIGHLLCLTITSSAGIKFVFDIKGKVR